MQKIALLFALLFAQFCAAQPSTAPAQEGTQIAISETIQRPARRACYECLPTPKNERQAQRIAYIKAVAPAAIAMEMRHGVPAWLAIAVAIYESGGGMSSIAQNSNNHFGIKHFYTAGEPQYHNEPQPYRCEKGRLWRSFRTVADGYDYFAQTHAIIGLKASGKPYTAANFANTGYGGRGNKKRYAAQLQDIVDTYNLAQL